MLKKLLSSLDAKKMIQKHGKQYHQGHKEAEWDWIIGGLKDEETILRYRFKSVNWKEGYIAFLTELKKKRMQRLLEK